MTIITLLVSIATVCWKWCPDVCTESTENSCRYGIWCFVCSIHWKSCKHGWSNELCEESMQCRISFGFTEQVLASWHGEMFTLGCCAADCRTRITCGATAAVCTLSVCVPITIDICMILCTMRQSFAEYVMLCTVPESTYLKWSSCSCFCHVSMQVIAL